ncbi:putative ribonuclease H-like domain-containing protein [Tanacetum coccineum]
MDVKSAFLYGKIEEEVYVCQPPGFKDPTFPDKVYKVEKALYRLHQAPRACQDKYMAEILKKFDFAIVKTASTPMKPNKALIKDEEAEDVDVHLYRSMIGSLMYLTASRPDITFAVSVCARFQVTPKTSHLHAVKRIFRYLKGQPKLGFWYLKDFPFDLEAFSDSDYAGASLDRKSTTGGCQFLGKRLISWQRKKQTIVANSTTEVEYVAAANCYGQVLWIQNQMLDYGFNFMNTKIYIGSESTICIVKNPVFHSKTKHIEIRYHFIRDSYEKKLIQVIKIYTDQNVTDLLTKAFDVSRGRDTKVPQSGGPPIKVGNKAVHKELGDRIERATTTASSLEAEQDSDTILGDANAQTRFGTASIKSNDPPLFKSNTLGSREDSMKLMELMKFNFSKYIFDSMVKNLENVNKFWMYLRFDQVFVNQQLGDMSKHKKTFVNPSLTKKLFGNMKREGTRFSRRVTPLFDTMMVQAFKEVGEDSDHLTNSNQIPIIDQPSTSSKHKKKQKSRWKQRKEVEVPQDETEHEESVPTPSNDPLPSGEDRMQLTDLMVLCTKLQKQVLDLEKAKSDQAIELPASRKVGAARRVESSEDKDSLGDQEDPSKQGRNIADIDQDVNVTLIDETQRKLNDEYMFGVMIFMTRSAPTTTIEELTLAQTLIEIKEAKPKTITTVTTADTSVTTTSITRPKAKGLVFHDQEEQVFVSKPTVSSTQPSIKEKGKEIMIETERPLKKKDQVAADEELTRQLDAKMQAEIAEEEKIRRKKEEESNITLIESWEYTSYDGG